MMSGTCEKIGFTDFSTMHFQYFTLLIAGPNSISSHVPGTFSAHNMHEFIVDSEPVATVAGVAAGASDTV
jgi:hypothetical protein